MSTKRIIPKSLGLENRKQPLLSQKQFVNRQLRFSFVSLVLIVISLLIGTVGYSSFCGISTVDGFYNACMILTGMGPVNQMPTDGAKLFSSFYALYSGVAFLTTSAVLLAPIIHRLLHILNLEAENEGKDEE
jgi:hypothetical protein